LAFVLFFQIFSVSSQLPSNTISNNNHNNYFGILQSFLAPSYGLLREGTYYDLITCELTANVKYEEYKKGFTKGKSLKELISPSSSYPYSSTTAQARYEMGYQDGFDCIVAKKTDLQTRMGNILASNSGDKSIVRELFAKYEALKQSVVKYNAVTNENDITKAVQIIDHFKQSWLDGDKGISEISAKLGISSISPQDTITNTGAGQQQQQQQQSLLSSSSPLTPSTTPPHIDSMKLLPGSSPQFFKCNETPSEGSPTLPGLDVESSANTAITDEDQNTEMLGKVVFDISFDRPIQNKPGPDLVIYEVGPGSPESFKVASVNNKDGSASSFKDYAGSSTSTTDDCGLEIYSAQIDLSDLLGITESEVKEEDSSGGDTTISTIRIDNNGAPGCCTGADISGISVIVTNETSSNSAITPLSSSTSKQLQPPVSLQPPSPPLQTANNAIETADLLEQGFGLYSLGQYQEAITWYDKALSIDPNNIEALNYKGVALSNLGKNEEAINWYDKALAIDPNNVNVLNNKGVALSNLGKNEEAINWYDKALSIDPNNIEALNYKGIALSNLGKNEEAINWYDKVLAIDPNNFNVFNNKGIALSNLGKNEEAITWYDKALAIKPIYVDPLYNKGLALNNLGKYEEAITWYDKALSIDPNNIEALNYKGIALSNLGKHE
jgi:tetratricopeptide (TPR) repeat protein